LEPEEQTLFEKFEHDLSLEDIVFFRSIADAVAIKEHKMASPELAPYHTKVKRWFESWLPGTGAEQFAEEEAAVHQ
jgi:hypothetical protein